MHRTWQGIVVLVFSSASAWAQVTGQDDLPAMHKTYQANEARFMRDYKGKPFEAVMPLQGVSENPFFQGSYRVGFGSGRITSEVDCRVSDKKTVDFVTDLNKGDMVRI